MAQTNLSGPLMVFGPAASAGGTNTSTGGAPSTFWQGTALQDPRTPYGPGTSHGSQAIGSWLMGTNIPLIDAVPSTLSATNIAAAAVPVAGTAMTLVSASGAGITVGASVYNRVTRSNLASVTALAIDTAYTDITSSGISYFDPSKAIARNIRITSAGNDSAATFTVRGYDLYGQALSETITGANAGVASGIKAFKYVASVTPAGTLSGSNASVGTGDVYGFGIRADLFPYVQTFWNNALITATTGFVAAVTTSPATATTGDVRGTYAVQTASDGTKRLVVSTFVPVSTLTGMTYSDPSLLVGVTQFSN